MSTRQGFALRGMHEALDDVRIEVRRTVAVGDRVVVLAAFSARGRLSGVERKHEDGYVWTIRDGKAVRFEWFNDPAKALKVVGLEE